MRKLFRIVAAACVLLLGPSRAEAQPPVVTNDPGQYASVLADAMVIDGVRPLRGLFEEIAGQVSVEQETALITYERAIAGRRAEISRVVEDVTLSNVFRAIYVYHYFGERAWLFTRLEFVRIGENEWALSSFSFSSEWGSVVRTMTPSFRPTSAPARR